MAGDMGEKTEEPTGKKLADARNQGQVPKSVDLTGAIGLTTAMLLILFLGDSTIDRFGAILRRVVSGQSFGGAPYDQASAYPVFVDTMSHGLLILVPFLAISFVVAAVVQIKQVGFRITTKPITPDINKLNPVKGFKRLLAVKNIVKTAINSAKMVIVLFAAFLLLKLRIGSLGALPGLEFTAAVMLIIRLMKEMALLLCIILLIIGIIDYVYQKWQHRRDLRMTKHEVKDERRSMEGDMTTKRKRFEMYRKIIVNQIQSNTPQADVVIANPTHFAVAIKYDPETMRAPRVTAKGADLLAFQMRSIAKANKVPIVERPPLARALYAAIEVGQEVAPEHYEAVAEVLAYVYRIDERARERNTPEGTQLRDQSRTESQRAKETMGAA